MLNDPIPIVKQTQLDQIYSNNLKYQQKRYQQLTTKFREQFGIDPTFIARSPGRCNTIGEHIDYSGYSVLPMAIEKDCIMAIATFQEEEATVTLANTNPKYPTRTIKHEAGVHVTIDSSEHEWSNYFKCGYKGVLDELNPVKVVSLKIMVDGTVPAGAGLSSSSAFVCCSSLAVLHANGGTMNKGELTKTAIKSECYAGVQIGGMDQSISIMAPKGSALLIDFYPNLNVTAIKVPGCNPYPVFVIANTLVTADKHVTAPTNYNLRVIECRLAAAVFQKKLSLNIPQVISTLKQIQEAYVGLENPIEGLEKMLQVTESLFLKEPYSLVQIAELLEITVEELCSKYIGAIVIRAENFKLYQRAKHVFSEALRVYQFQSICQKNPADLLNQLGNLMNESHYSCRDLFDCSCNELDELTSLCRAEGALGSRLTGAGWGGCTVSLVPSDKVEGLLKAIKEKYYLKRNPEWANDPKFIEDCLFSTVAGIGATILK